VDRPLRAAAPNRCSCEEAPQQAKRKPPTCLVACHSASPEPPNSASPHRVDKGPSCLANRNDGRQTRHHDPPLLIPFETPAGQTEDLSPSRDDPLSLQGLSPNAFVFGQNKPARARRIGQPLRVAHKHCLLPTVHAFERVDCVPNRLDVRRNRGSQAAID
jgi:hypothetical protein